MSIEAMKQALEALENVRGYDVENLYGFDDEITALRQAIEQAEKQEPVAWRFQSAVGGWAYGKEPPIGSKYAVEPLYAALPHDFDNVTDDALIEEVRRRGFTIRDAQISPKREWHGLGINQRIRLADRFHIGLDAVETIEAKLKERNT